jgi:serine/threonine protein kinase
VLRLESCIVYDTVLTPMSRPSEHRDAPLPRPSTADEERLGTVIDGRYRLDAIVGRGGMGLVYKAEHVGIRRTVALKLLHTSLAAVPELRSRFEREARAIGVISHPNCVDVTDFGELADGSLYLVMEYIEGKSLGDILDRERVLEPRRALRILRHVLNGLGHAHAAGIVHRDVKPENVLLLQQGNDPDFAKILDFGIAKLVARSVDDGVKLTQAGVAFGTPVYMSPEQALGNPVDARADLYAASIMAYEMITGRPPFYSDDKLEVLSMHTTRPLPPMDEMRRNVLGARATPLPPGVEAVVFKGLTKQPRDRWQTAKEYVAAIDDLLVQLQLDDDVIGGETGARPLLTADGSSLIRDVGGVGRDPLFTPTALSTAAPPSDHLDATAEREPQLTPTRLVTPAALASGMRAPLSEPVMLVPPTRTSKVRSLPSRLKSYASRKPKVVAAAGAGLLLVAGLAIFLAVRDDSPAQPPKSEIASEAAETLERGDPASVIKSLEARKDEIASDPTAQVQLGHAYAARREHAPALLAYRRAMELAPVLESDGTLRANLNAISNDTDMAAAMAAYELLITMTNDAEARARLIRDASGEDAERRRAAGALAERLGIGSEVDWYTAYILDLDQSDGCPKRREAVAKLRALGDPRAIPALEAAIVRKGKTGKWKGKPINKCLQDAARAAITFLAGVGDK